MENKNSTDFSFYIRSLALQASIALGVIKHPITNQLEKNLPHAKLIIDTFLMLKEKTLGNLTTEQDSLLDKFIYELKLQYQNNENSPANSNKEEAI